MARGVDWLLMRRCTPGERAELRQQQAARRGTHKALQERDVHRPGAPRGAGGAALPHGARHDRHLDLVAHRLGRFNGAVHCVLCLRPLGAHPRRITIRKRPPMRLHGRPLFDKHDISIQNTTYHVQNRHLFFNFSVI